jgi:uncharacterized protein YjiS (DUF1127 family)
MSTIHGTTELSQATAARHVFSPLEVYWAAFQARRKRARVRARLVALSDRELVDIGVTRAEIDYVASIEGVDPRGAA